MTRGTTVDLQDPIEATRYNGLRSCAQAADFLQLLGFGVTAGSLEQFNREGKLSLSRDGKIKDAGLLKLAEKQPPWLKSQPHPEKPGEGMITIRQAIATFPQVKLELLVSALCDGAEHFIVTEGRKRFIVIHESWIRVTMLRQGDKPPATLPTAPTTPAKVTPATTMVPKAEEPTITTAKPAEPQPTEAPSATPTAEPICTKTTCYTVKAAVALLGEFDFPGATEAKVYFHIDKGEIKIVARKPRILIAEDELERLMDSPPPWLMRGPNRMIPPEGVLTGIMLAEKHECMLTRVYAAIQAGFIPATSMTPEGAERNIWYIDESIADAAVAHPVLGAYLKGDKLTIEEVATQLGVDFVVETTTRTSDEAPPNDTPEDVEIIDTTSGSESSSSEPEENSSDPAKTFGEVMIGIHRCLVVVRDYEVAITDGWTEEDIADHFSDLLKRI